MEVSQFFLVGPPDDEDGVASIPDSNGGWWMPIFTSQELAELYAEQAGLGQVPREMDYATLRNTLAGHEHISGLVLNLTSNASSYSFVKREDFFAAFEDPWSIEHSEAKVRFYFDYPD